MYVIEYFLFYKVAYDLECRANSKAKLLLLSLVYIIVKQNHMNTINEFLIHLIIVFVCLYIFYDVTIKRHICYYLSGFIILTFCEMAVSIFLNFINKMDSINRSIITEGVTIIISLIFYVCKNKEVKTISLRTLYMLDIIMLFSLLFLSFVQYLLDSVVVIRKIQKVGVFFLIVGGAVFVFLYVVIIHYSMNIQSLIKRKGYEKQKNAMQKEYYEKLLEKEKETRAFRHDIMNDLLEIRYFCYNKDFQKATDYLDNMLSNLQHIYNLTYNVGNDTINVILNYYLNSLSDKYKVIVEGHIDGLSINQRDLSIVVSNIVENAVEALEKYGSGELYFSVLEGNRYIRICVENDFDGVLGKEKNGIIQTSKNDKQLHGYGLKNTKKIVEKYNGNYCVNVCNHKYVVTIDLEKPVREK